MDPCGTFSHWFSISSGATSFKRNGSKEHSLSYHLNHSIKKKSRRRKKYIWKRKRLFGGPDTVSWIQFSASFFFSLVSSLCACCTFQYTPYIERDRIVYLLENTQNVEHGQQNNSHIMYISSWSKLKKKKKGDEKFKNDERGMMKRRRMEILALVFIRIFRNRRLKFRIISNEFSIVCNYFKLQQNEK